MTQAFALSTCSAWASGMEMETGGYTGQELDRELQLIEEEESLTKNE
jgi:hypothetical protein